MGRPAIDLTDKMFGRLVVLCKDEDYTGSRGEVYWICKCSCDKKSIVSICGTNLRLDRVHSCGCLTREKSKERLTTHGLSKHPLFSVLHDMKKRCYNPNDKDFKYYGGRGIAICETWLADVGAFIRYGIRKGWKPGLTIDRINPNGNYQPGNVRWIPMCEQPLNRRNMVGR